MQSPAHSVGLNVLRAFPGRNDFGAVHPYSLQAGFLSAVNIEQRVVADIYGFGWLHFKRIAGCVKDRGIRLGAAELARGKRDVKMLRQPDDFEIGGTVGD